MTHPDMIESIPLRPKTRPGSLSDSLLLLEIGGEHTLVEYLDPAEADVSEEGISARKSALSSVASRTISRLKSMVPTLDYQTESAAFFTSRNRIYVALIITRIS